MPLRVEASHTKTSSHAGVGRDGARLRAKEGITHIQYPRNTRGHSLKLMLRHAAFLAERVAVLSEKPVHFACSASRSSQFRIRMYKLKQF